jgi:integrase
VHIPSIDHKNSRQTFEAVAEDFIRHIHHKQKLRTAPTMERTLRTVFVARWKRRPITDIAAEDIKAIIREIVDRGAKYEAFREFALIRRLFNWAIGTDDYGLEVNPCRRLKPGDLIGERNDRERTLTDDEIKALWRVTRRFGYPYGPLYRLLLLTGCRLNEVCGAQWDEFDLPGRLWTVPPERMKKVKGGAKPHFVPLTDSMLKVLESVPTFNKGDHLFSHSFGARPLKPSQFGGPKERLDRRLLRTLRAMARLQGEKTKRVILKPLCKPRYQAHRQNPSVGAQSPRRSPRGGGRPCAARDQRRWLQVTA